MKPSRPRLVACASLVALALPGGAHAVAIKLTDPTPTYLAEAAHCVGVDATAYTHCTSTALLDLGASLGGSDASFKQSFDAWNTGNAATGKWSLKDGGKLPGGIFQVSTFDAIAEAGSGGLEIQIDWTYAGADKGDYFWAQGLYDNYSPSLGKMIEPIYKMDVLDGKDLAAPLYPFSYAERYFYDMPAGFWPGAFFEARAFIAQADYTARILTLYEGVSYEFHLEIPEPSGALLALLGLGSLAARRPRR